MALVGAAAGADDLGPGHAVAGVGQILEMPLGERLGEAWPAGPALELRSALEQRQPAQPASVKPVALLVKEDAAEGGLGAMVEEDVAFFVAQLVRQGDKLLLARRVRSNWIVVESAMFASIEVRHPYHCSAKVVSGLPFSNT